MTSDAGSAPADPLAAAMDPDLGRSEALTVALLDDGAPLASGAGPLAASAADHRRHRDSPHGEVVGPLLVPASRVRELAGAADELVSTSDPLPVVLVGDGGLVGLAEARAALLDDDRIDVVGVQAALPAVEGLGDAARALLDSLDVAAPAAVEVPRGRGWREALDVLADDGAEHAALRLAYHGEAGPPTDHQVALWVHACLERRLAFTLTGGIDAAVRADGPAGPRHGLLNVLAAVAAGLDGGSLESVEEVVGLRDPALLLAVMGTADARDLRRALPSVTVSGLDAGVAALREAGLLAAPGRG